MRTTRFTDPASVDAWDQWFRWRDADGLRDRTIDATWARVAQAIVPAGDPDSAQRARRYVEAFSRWQLLPDERLLRLAGTGPAAVSLESSCAALNAAAFVVAPATRQARFDDERFADVAALAVRLLDDARPGAGGEARRHSQLRIGLIGFADALHLLGIGYSSNGAVELAGTLGAALSAGTLRGELEAIEARGPLVKAGKHQLAVWKKRRVPDWQLERLAVGGVRHSALTAIWPQPALALLANRASDALDPHAPAGEGAVARTGPTAGCGCQALPAAARDAARRAIHAAIQPWIDAPIEEPEARPPAPTRARR